MWIGLDSGGWDVVLGRMGDSLEDTKSVIELESVGQRTKRGSWILGLGVFAGGLE